MALIQTNFFSNSLARVVPITVILPTDKRAWDDAPDRHGRPCQTLYLLHGIFGDSMSWPTNSCIRRYAEEHDLAVVMPAGENSFYLDHAASYAFFGDFVGRELVEQTRKMFPLSRRREDTFIGGLSMGGYGALRTGLKYRETFSAIVALSSALVLEDNRRKGYEPGIMVDRAYAENCFGDLNRAMESDENPLWLARQAVEQGERLPALYIACGEQDGLLPNSRAFVEELRQLGVDVTFETAPGGHEWDFWDSQIRHVIEDWLPLESKEEYDFHTLVSRKNTGSFKWDQMGDQPEGVAPLSVADMELKNPPQIAEGLKEYLDGAILGYTGPTEDYFASVQSWMERRHGFRPEKEWIVPFAGVVPALNQLVRTCTRPGDSVLIMTPVYYPFYSAVEDNGRKLVKTQLTPMGDRYEIDFDDFAAKAALPEVKLLILCSPHNPVGRVWSREELERIAQICLEQNVFIVSDEIHFDLILPGYRHTSMGNLPQPWLDNCVICTAPSKTFNLAGMQASNLLVPNKTVRERLRRDMGFSHLNILGYQACRLAYDKCEGWLDALLLHLDGNRQLVEDFLAQKLPCLKPFRLEGTYLMWIDCRALGLDKKELERFMQQEARWFCDEGYLFGSEGAGFERLNLACPRWVLEQALERLEQAVRARFPALGKD